MVWFEIFVLILKTGKSLCEVVKGKISAWGWMKMYGDTHIGNISQKLKGNQVYEIVKTLWLSIMRKRNLHMFYLIVPLTTNMEIRNEENSKKYAPFVNDITGFKCSNLAPQVI